MSVLSLRTVVRTYT